MIHSSEEAAELALRELSNPDWEPVVTEVHDAGSAWRVFYNSRSFVETEEIAHALGGNLPLLIDKVAETITRDASYLPRWKARIQLRLLPPASGRSRSISSGYRPTWRSDRKPEWNDGAIWLDSVESLEPGNSTAGWLLPAVPHLWTGLIVPGDRLDGAEGSKLVVDATVLALDLWRGAGP